MSEEKITYDKNDKAANLEDWTIEMWGFEMPPIPKSSTWISVAERKPEQGVDVLAYIYYPPLHSSEMKVVHYATGPLGEYWGDEEYGYTGYVTHWMPLPEPPDSPPISA